MLKPLRVICYFCAFFLIYSGTALSDVNGFFRSIPVDTPQKGILRVSNSSYYSKIQANDVLIQKYGISKSTILSSITNLEVGVTNYLSVTGTLPYYADMFSQGGRTGEKTGGGDISAGVRFAYTPEESILHGVSVGGRALIPERMVFGQEPLGFRTFSSGKQGYALEASIGARLKFIDTYFSASMFSYPGASQPDSALQSDVFYESGFGYRGIGQGDNAGYSLQLYHGQLRLTGGGMVPIRSWMSGFVEYDHTMFLSGPSRDSITRFTPGIRIGNTERIHASIGINVAINGPIPDKTYQFKLTIPTFSRRKLKKPSEIKEKMRRIPGQGEQARAQNMFVAVKKFEKSDNTYVYENELRGSFEKQLNGLGVFNVVPGSHVDKVFTQRSLVPLTEKSTELGVRLGASYLINTDIFDYSIVKKSRFTIPLIVGFPGTLFSIKARASVIDLVSGQTHDLGVIEANVMQPRGVRFFPLGESSDIVHLSEPEILTAKGKLIDSLVHNLNNNIIERIYLFDWDPKRIIIRGDEETNG